MAKTRYRALTTIDYISTRSGVYVRVEAGDEFDDMNRLSIRNELEHGNIKEVQEGGEKS